VNSFATPKAMCDKKTIRVMKDSALFCNRNANIVLQRAEEVFPTVRESMVSVLCFCP
jgi:hypothetical protein